MTKTGLLSPKNPNDDPEIAFDKSVDRGIEIADKLRTKFRGTVEKKLPSVFEMISSGMK